MQLRRKTAQAAMNACTVNGVRRKRLRASEPRRRRARRPCPCLWMHRGVRMDAWAHMRCAWEWGRLTAVHEVELMYTYMYMQNMHETGACGQQLLFEAQERAQSQPDSCGCARQEAFPGRYLN